jgi:hypothetical protein
LHVAHLLYAVSPQVELRERHERGEVVHSGDAVARQVQHSQVCEPVQAVDRLRVWCGRVRLRLRVRLSWVEVDIGIEIEEKKRCSEEVKRLRGKEYTHTPYLDVVGVQVQHVQLAELRQVADGADLVLSRHEHAQALDHGQGPVQCLDLVVVQV